MLVTATADKIPATANSMIRLVGAALAHQGDEWTESRRYMGSEILAACRKAAEKKDGGAMEVTNGAKFAIGAISG